MSNENGTVAVKFVKPNGPFMPGDVAGFDPAIAETLKKKGVAVDPNEKVAEKPEKAATTKLPQETKPPQAAAPVNPDEVVIPDDWESEHHFKQIALALQLKPDEVKPDKARAIDIIKTEIERRKANEQ